MSVATHVYASPTCNTPTQYNLVNQKRNAYESFKSELPQLNQQTTQTEQLKLFPNSSSFSFSRRETDFIDKWNKGIRKVPNTIRRLQKSSPIRSERVFILAPNKGWKGIE